MDFVPMALRAAGLALPTDRVLDGRDPSDTLAGRAASPHECLYWRWGTTGAAIRMGRHKLIREQDSSNQDWQLFDLQADVGESTDLRATKPGLAEHLRTEYERWTAEVTSNR
jgi:arylsulfatase A-like enzyme